MKWKWYILAVVAVVVFIIMALQPQQRHFEWRVSVPSATGDQPYDMMLFDSLMARSLPYGYSVQMLDTVDANVSVPHDKDSLFLDENEVPLLPEIEAADAQATSLLVVQSYDWLKRGWDDYPTRHANPTRSLIDFAKRGGRSLLVLSNDFFMHDVTTVVGGYVGMYDVIMLNSDEYSYSGTTYTPEWFAQRDDRAIYVDDSLELRKRFAINSFAVYRDEINEYNRLVRKDSVRIDGCPLLVPIMVDAAEDTRVYAIDMFFPRSGGHLYVTTLGMYFCNLGLTIPGGTAVMEHLMGRIDDRAVVRLQYPYKVSGNMVQREANKHAILDKVRDSEALSFAWTLLLVLVVLILSCGLVRRYPAAKGVAADDLDKTDAVAVREYQFRHSPLLHFIFQCSWLYEGKGDYSELFAVNFRRLARVVSRTTGVELQSAKDDELRSAAAVLAARQGRDEQEVMDELAWMRYMHQFHKAKVLPHQYAKSQKIVERY